MIFVMNNSEVWLKVDIGVEIEISEMLQCKGCFALLEKVNLDLFSLKGKWS